MFDAFDRLVSDTTDGTTTAYGYDGLGRLAVRNSTTRIVYGGLEREPVVDGSAYSRDPDGDVISIGTAAGNWATLTDTHGDLTAAFPTSGAALTDSRSYDPFGEPLVTGSTAIRVGYQGSWTDPTTGKVSAQARWYTPGTGGFASRDPADLPFTGSASTNRYLYANANPLAYNDLSGYGPIGWVKGKAKAAANTVKDGAVWLKDNILPGDRNGGTATIEPEPLPRSVPTYSGNVKSPDMSYLPAPSYAPDRPTYNPRAYGPPIVGGSGPARPAGPTAAPVPSPTAAPVTAPSRSVSTVRPVPAPVVSPYVVNRPTSTTPTGAFPIAAPVTGPAPGPAAGPTGGVPQTRYVAAPAYTAPQATTPAPAPASPPARSYVAAPAGVSSAGAGGAPLATAYTAVRPVTALTRPTPKPARAAAPEKRCSWRDLKCSLGGALSWANDHKVDIALTVASFIPPAAPAAVAARAAMITYRGTRAVTTATRAVRPLTTALRPAATTERAAGQTSRALRNCVSNSFDGDTPVLLADGTTTPIADIRIGDRVLATNPDTGQTEPHTVTALIIGTGDKDLVDITVDTPTGPATLTATAGHPFWDTTDHEWVDAEDLTTSDTLRTPDGHQVPIASTHDYHQHDTVYNLTIDTLHTYYVLAGHSPVLVHNTPPSPCSLISAADAPIINSKTIFTARERSFRVDIENQNPGHPGAAIHLQFMGRGSDAKKYYFNPSSRNWMTENSEILSSRIARQVPDSVIRKAFRYLGLDGP
ncbi:polymorphic toxin-type HINT domain-containing protein [Parafrankia elaeagni]